MLYNKESFGIRSVLLQEVRIRSAADPTRGTGPFAPFVQFVCVSSGPVQRTILVENA